MAAEPNPSDWLADEQRAALIAREEALARQMLRLYAPSHEYFAADVENMRKFLAKSANLSSAERKRRIQPMLDKLHKQQEMDRFLSKRAADLAEHGQRLNLYHGKADADDFADLIAGDQQWRELPMEALKFHLGFGADGAPLRRHFSDLNDEMFSGFQHQLFMGLSKGQSTADIAVRLHAAVDEFTRRRCVLIARQEGMRAYREGNLASLRHNARLCPQWRWRAVLSARSCACCIALNGTLHPITEDFGSHVLCRCCAVPVSIADHGDHGPTGEEWFAQQPEEEQAKILGPAHLQLYRDGKITLADIVDRHETVWGPTANIRPVKGLVARGVVTEEQGKAALARPIHAAE